MEKLLLAAWFLCSLFQAVHSYAINGVHAGVNNITGARPFRQNINVFKNSGPAWDLYVLSLQKFMAVDQRDNFSYFKIAGIHGYPANSPWDGVIGKAGGIGYCEHGSVLFPVWHRPYLAIFEEQVWQFAQEIASQYNASQQAQYKAAAVSLRIPYWDWSLEPTLPDVTTTPQISVNTPKGKQVIDNPLYAYKFHPFNSKDFPDLPQYSATVREPNLRTLKSQLNLVNKNLESSASYWHDNAYLLLSSTSDWSTFSTNLDYLHGGIHDSVGGPTDPNVGHMTFLWYAAFDPIFWLHHAQVDRLVAIWQAIHPYSYIRPQKSTVDTYYTRAGTTQTDTSPLAPFRRDTSGNFHSGETVRFLKTFGYSYPELVYWSKTGSNVTTLQQEVTAIVNKLYRSKSSKTNGVNALDGMNGNSQPTSSLDVGWEWKFDIKIDQKSTATPISVAFLYNGTIPVGPEVLLQSPNNKMGAKPFATSSASIPLTQILLLDSNDLEPGMVVSRIKHNIIGDVTGAINISLVARQIRQPLNSTDFPQYGAWKEYGKATLSKGGLINWR